MTPDQVAFWAFIVVGVQAVIFFVQTGLLWWYASETRKLRIDAAHQNKLITEQIQNTLKQNELMASQLKVMAEGLEFQRQTIEQEAEPAFHLAVSYVDNHCCKVRIQNIKKNVLFIEVRSNNPHATCCLYRKHSREVIFSRNPDGMSYIAAVYRTYRGQVKAQVFTYFTGNKLGLIENAPATYDYRLLDIVGRSDMTNAKK